MRPESGAPLEPPGSGPTRGSDISGDFVRVGKTSDFPDGIGVPIDLGARRIVIYRQGEELFALKDICPHQGDLLHRLPPKDGAAVCPGHGWRFDLRTGRCVRGDPETRVAVYPVEVRNGEVLVGRSSRGSG